MQAKHILGAEVLYQQLSPGIYKVKLKVYRDCAECKFNGHGGGNNTEVCSEIPDLVVRPSAGEKDAGKNIGTIALTRVSIKKLTPTCNTVSDLCSTSPGINIGFEEHVLEGVFTSDLYKQMGYCKVDLSISMSSRSEYLSPSGLQSQNFYNYTTIEICSFSANNQVVFTNTPFFIVGQNQPIHFSNSVLLTDPNDSISFKLKAAKISPNRTLDYPTGVSAEIPVNVNCSSSPCLPDPNKLNPEGFYLNSQNGDIVFMPITINQFGVIVIEVEQWGTTIFGQRKLKSVTRRDFQIKVIQATNNVPLFSPNIFSTTVCEGNKVCFTIQANDRIFASRPADSVSFYVSNLIPDATFVVKPLANAPYKEGEFCWQTKQGDYRKEPYRFSVKIKDNACPLNANSSRTFEIHVEKKLDYSISKQLRPCNKYSFEAVNNSSEDDDKNNVLWTVKDWNQNNIFIQAGKRFDYNFPIGGRFYIQCDIISSLTGCKLVLTDSIIIPQFSKIRAEIDTVFWACPNEPKLVQLKSFKADAPYFILWNDTAMGNSVVLSANNNSKIKVKITDRHGCEMLLSSDFKIFKRPEYVLKDTIVCATTRPEINLLTLISGDFDLTKAAFKVIENTGVILRDNNSVFFKSNTNAAYNHKVEVTFLTEKACSILDTITLYHKAPIEIRYHEVRPICENEEKVSLPFETEIQVEGGAWNVFGFPDAIDSMIYLNPGKLNGHGNYQVNYVFNGYACPVEKSFNVKVIQKPSLNFNFDDKTEVCNNFSPIQLVASPQGGEWGGAVSSDGLLKPWTLGVVDKEVYARYYYQNPITKCTNSDSVSFIIRNSPSLELEPVSSEYCQGDTISLVAIFNGYKPGDYHWNFSHVGSFNKIGQSEYYSYLPLIKSNKTEEIKLSVATKISDYCPWTSDSISFLYHPIPSGSIENITPIVCDNSDLKLKNNTGGVVQFVWVNKQINEMEADTGVVFNMNLPVGKYQVQVFSSYKGCNAIIPLQDSVIVSASPTAFFLSDPGIYASVKETRFRLINKTQSEDAYYINWYLGNQKVFNQRDFFWIFPSDTGIYNIKLVATTVAGCQDSFSKNIYIGLPNEIFIPQVFSPDHEGPVENNYFTVVSKQQLSNYSIEIFTRWGEKVYMSNDINDAWDGKFNGQYCLPGTYVFVIHTTDRYGKKQDYKGVVLLIR